MQQLAKSAECHFVEVSSFWAFIKMNSLPNFTKEYLETQFFFSSFSAIEKLISLHNPCRNLSLEKISNWFKKLHMLLEKRKSNISNCMLKVVVILQNFPYLKAVKLPVNRQNLATSFAKDKIVKINKPGTAEIVRFEPLFFSLNVY